jgi:hypothetical protein
VLINKLVFFINVYRLTVKMDYEGNLENALYAMNATKKFGQGFPPLM